MGRPYTSHRVICFFAFVGWLLVSTLGYSQTKTKSTAPSPEIQRNKKEGIPFSTYSKNGSDSISLIVFGRILIKSSPEQTTPTSDGADKNSKKKEKFSIKSTDKLKTDNALY